MTAHPDRPNRGMSDGRTRAWTPEEAAAFHESIREPMLAMMGAAFKYDRAVSQIVSAMVPEDYPTNGRAMAFPLDIKRKP